jgi:hypothetical protein
MNNNKLIGLRKVIKIDFNVTLPQYKKEIIRKYITQVISKINKSPYYIIVFSKKSQLINVLNSKEEVITSFYCSEIIF